MKRRRRNQQNRNEDDVELNEALEAYEELQWADQNIYEETSPEMQETFPQDVVDEYHDFYDEEYSEEHERLDSEGKFHIALGVLDLISIIVGIIVILVLVGMIVTLFNWLRNDILQSALLLQSGLQ